MVSLEIARRFGKARSAQKEVLATLLEAVLMPRDLSPVIPTLKDGEHVVVLVHGLLATAGVFRPMRSRLESEGFRVASFTYAPGRSVPAIAKQLASVVKRIPSSCRVHIVGHSMGGVVARYYVQRLGGHERVAQTLSLASPFHGTPIARRFTWLAKDLHPESHLLRAVRSCPPHVRVPHTSLVAEGDRLIPPDSARFPGSPCIVLSGRGHNTLLFDPEVVDILLANLRPESEVAA